MSTTTPLDPLRGSCSCGRNQYLIQIPDDVTDYAEVYFDDSSDNRTSIPFFTCTPANAASFIGRFHGTPLTAWLRVPLDWYQSHTRSYFPDETHRMIRRTFTPHHAPHTQRKFCGFCGTPLTFWSESPRGEADFMSVTVGSLSGDDQRTLEDLDLLPGSSEEEEESEPDEDDNNNQGSEEEEEADEEIPATASRDSVPASSTAAAAAPLSSSSVVVPTIGREPLVSRSYRHGNMGGIPWFEEMIEGSRLGRIMKGRRGMGASDDDSTKFQWEVSEWHDDGSGGSGAVRQMQSSSSSSTFSSSRGSSGKRKRGTWGELEGSSQQQRRTGSP